MGIQERKIRLSMDVTELQMADSTHGQKSDFFLGSWRETMLHLISETANLRWKKENLEQEELLYGENLR